MPPAMGQPINVVEKPSSNPGIARFETNRSFTGMGHERYASREDILDDRPVDELARRLFDSGGVTQVHANGSMVTVHLADGWTGAQLLDVIRGLYIFYPPATNGDAAQVPEAEEAEADEADEAAAAPEVITERDTAVELSEAPEAETAPADEPVAAESEPQK